MKSKKKVYIIGSGISGATLANILASAKWDVELYEKNNHIAGNCYDTYDKNGVLIHIYGPHIFHTNDEKIYKYISNFAKFNNYINKVVVSVNNKTFPLPINFCSIETIVHNKENANEIVSWLKKKYRNKKTISLFELKKSKNKKIIWLANYIEKNVYANYSSKMWGTTFKNVDTNTINRIKILLSYEHNYFPNDKYQGLPIGGYTKMIKKMLSNKHIHIHLNKNALSFIKLGENIFLNNKKIHDPLIYCGSLDELLNYKYGQLPYRSLNIKFKSFRKDFYQKYPVINYPADLEMTRITEYKHMTLQHIKNKTTISKEFPGKFSLHSKFFSNRYYPIVNEKNLHLYDKYASFFKKYSNFYPLGRLAQYKYFDMDDAIYQAIKLGRKLINV